MDVFLSSLLYSQWEEGWRGSLYLLVITSHLCSALLHFGKHLYSALLALLKPNIRVIPVVYFTHPDPVMNSEDRMESVVFINHLHELKIFM